MLALLWLPLVLQVVVPAALLLWLALARPPGYVAWFLSVALVAGYVALVDMAGLWLAVPAVLPALHAALLLAAAALSLRRVRAREILPRGPRAVAGVALRGVAVALVAAALAYVQGAHRVPPGEVVALDFPLHQGTYVAVNAGSLPVANAHLMTLEGERFRAYRGQSHAVDLVRVNHLGLRASGPLPRDPAAYAIFGDTVVAPCPGRVITAQDGHPDLTPPHPDRAHMAGNHVILACGDVWVVLAHLRRGSVRVSAGEAVHVGDPLGVVGNSGNTNEPHLHVHAQRPGTPAMPLGGEPLPIRLDGRYLVRNDRVLRTAPPRPVELSLEDRR